MATVPNLETLLRESGVDPTGPSARFITFALPKKERVNPTCINSDGVVVGRRHRAARLMLRRCVSCSIDRVGSMRCNSHMRKVLSSTTEKNLSVVAPNDRWLPTDRFLYVERRWQDFFLRNGGQFLIRR